MLKNNIIFNFINNLKFKMTTQYREVSINLAKKFDDVIKSLNVNDFYNMKPNEMANVIRNKMEEVIDEIDIPDDFSVDDIAEIYKILRDRNINLDNDNSNETSPEFNIYKELRYDVYTDDYINDRMNVIKSGEGIQGLFDLVGINEEEFNNKTMEQLYPNIIRYYFGLSYTLNIDHLIEHLSNNTRKPLHKDKIINLERVKFESKMENKQCFICLSDYTEEDILINLPCSHYSHSGCMEKWLKLTDTCPICRCTIE